jgi:isoleucyl-tRNA synthetase
VALDLTLDDDLRLRGLAREVVRNVQELRKATGLEVSDWIELTLLGLDDLGPFFGAIAREVLARSITTTTPPDGGVGTSVVLDDAGSAREATVWLIKA